MPPANYAWSWSQPVCPAPLRGLPVQLRFSMARLHSMLPPASLAHLVSSEASGLVVVLAVAWLFSCWLQPVAAGSWWFVTAGG